MRRQKSEETKKLGDEKVRRQKSEETKNEETKNSVSLADRLLFGCV